MKAPLFSSHPVVPARRTRSAQAFFPWQAFLFSFLLFSGPPAAATAVDPDALFSRARSAYHAGQAAAAVRAYRRVEKAGFRHPHLLYNLGNACFLSGDKARALWYYRRAMREAPRDPDIQANLAFVLKETGTSLPSAGRWPVRFFQALSRREWSRFLFAGYTLCALCLGAARWGGERWRRAWMRLAAVGAVVLALGGIGFLTWAWTERHPEAVVIGKPAHALFAPVEGQAESFPLPYASLVRITRRDHDWCRIRRAGREGWVPAAQLAPLDMPSDEWEKKKEGTTS